MSGDPRQELVEAAARLLTEQGPRSLSARALARETGTSTMAVYTYFGGMPGLVRAVIREGFARLAERLATVRDSDDPVADSFRLAAAYRRSAHLAPHLYAVMFGGSSIAGFQLSEEDRRIGLYTLRVARDAVSRCIEAGRFRPADPWSVTRHLWCQLHGLVSLELTGYLTATDRSDDEFRAYLRNLAVGAGDTPQQAEASIAVARKGIP
ncbi:TetR/AcrR family transcriptional regulator [Rhizomonospora bruguierae]|uniref:TetR/AcrR family transcriptional regulator n=1 Tax=Rhizomonospora bruguierae TaxID=1581705 RepID=UPI001BD16D9F|nr:TetR/AcrR family transcriptional regulator [Micromonospora sp. NBRC 107566]